MSPSPKPLSKAEQTRRADKTLRGLLRTPKSRAGLIASVAGGKISRNYVFGWLAERRRDGTLAVHKSGNKLTFQIVTKVVDEVAEASSYPSWLDPRSLPLSTGRTVVVDGETVSIDGVQIQPKVQKYAVID